MNRFIYVDRGGNSDTMSICYYLPIKDELEYIQKSIPNILKHMGEGDELLISLDIIKTPQSVRDYLSTYKDEYGEGWFREEEGYPHIKVVEFEWCDDFSELKNLPFTHSEKEWIFQLDADENLPPTLLKSLRGFLEDMREQGFDSVLVPRINTYTDLDDHPNFLADNYLLGVTNEKGWVHWPEHQLRIYRNLNYVRWMGDIHESIQGVRQTYMIHPDESFAIIHEKTIVKQEESDKYYQTFERHNEIHTANIKARKEEWESRKNENVDERT